MTEVASALKVFCSGFSLPAYATDTVPNDVDLPYLTYPVIQPEWDQKASFYIQGWYRTTDLTEMLKKADEIAKEIGIGITISTANGFLVIYPETPLIQTMVESNDIRSFYISLSINSYHMPGV